MLFSKQFPGEIPKQAEGSDLMIGEEIREILSARYGDDFSMNSSYYGIIAEWESWWRGHNRSFHEFYENAAGGRIIRRELYRMNMAKKICEDWAALLLNDRTVIRVDDEVGAMFVGKVFRETDFMTQANRLVEKAFAVGTGAVILRLGGLTAAEDGTLSVKAGEGSVSFEWVDAAHILPLSVQNGIITEAAFVSEGIRRGEEYVYLEIHELEEDGYVIRNEIYIRENGELVRKAVEGEESCACAEIHTGSRTPLFSILSPNIQNNFDDGNGLGVSVFADAIDCLKGVDLAFNNFCRDIKLGGKKVFLNQSLISRDDQGNILTPDDVAQQLFVPLGDSDFSDHPMIVEHNPELRTTENSEAVQSQLNYLSFRCGLGTHHYTFTGVDGRTRLTATQYMGERQDMRQNAVKHQKKVEAFLRGAVRALLWAAETVFCLDIDRNAEIAVTFDDSYFTDSESQRSRDLAELEAGVRTAEEYRRKWLTDDVDI